mmetsp:Transcript_86529/g.279284  ORF Transcript_86529/g.279284 Transcript_86529/m.279284 type:complete len:115 (-) Transcript_86529:415-759(-)
MGSKNAAEAPKQGPRVRPKPPPVASSAATPGSSVCPPKLPELAPRATGDNNGGRGLEDAPEPGREYEEPGREKEDPGLEQEEPGLESQSLRSPEPPNVPARKPVEASLPGGLSG